MVTLRIPAGISAIFEPFMTSDPFMTGARGAGVAAADAVEISVSIKRGECEGVCVDNVVNGERVVGGVGVLAAKKVAELLQLSNCKIVIEQRIKVPMASGFGTSGASALGIVLGISLEAGRNLSLLQAADIAHLAELEARTGLGTVAGLAYPGDIVVVARAGAPSLSIIDHIIVPGDDVFVILCSRGRIETASKLSEEDFIDRARSLGKLAVDALLRESSVEAFFRIAKWFSRELGLATKAVVNAIDEAERAGAIGAAQAMIGDAVFALAYKEDVEEVRKTLEGALRAPALALRMVRAGYSIGQQNERER